jgi:hypothetical protein
MLKTTQTPDSCKCREIGLAFRRFADLRNSMAHKWSSRHRHFGDGRLHSLGTNALRRGHKHKKAPRTGSLQAPISALAFARTRAKSAFGILPLRTAPRARQSTLFSWSERTTLGGFVPAGTSNGYPLILVVKGQHTIRPVFPL